MKFAAYADACLVIEMLAARLNWEKPLTWSTLAIDLMPSVYRLAWRKNGGWRAWFGGLQRCCLPTVTCFRGEGGNQPIVKT